MFTTFPSAASCKATSSTTSASSTFTQSARPRQKRTQVRRACDWCRTHRIKCDDNYPCLNCQTRRGQCSNDRTGGIRTLPHAYREIERLRERQKELQDELDQERSLSRSQSKPLVLTPSSPESLTYPADANDSPHGYWDGIYIRTPQSSMDTWYGPSSLVYFISRMSAFLASRCSQGRLVSPPSLTPKELSSGLDNQLENPTNKADRITPHDHIKAEEVLTPAQEEYFFDLYWQSYHTSLPVLNEAGFRNHYKSLWSGSGKNRKQSALIDIVIAVCMQYGVARARINGVSSKASDVDAGDAALAGRSYYCRCQTILAHERDSPTIATLQCNILSTIWLCCASLQNMADNTLALTARTAQRLGLHLPPPPDASPCERELRKRLWWSIYVLETKTNMKLGRPFLLHPSRTNCGLPGDDHDAVSLSGSSLAPLDPRVTWLSWNLHNTKLVLAARSVYVAFYDKYPDLFGGNDGQTIYDAPSALEPYADFLIAQMKALESWVEDDVPDALKTRRQNHGAAFSTDGSPLDIEQFAPLWLRQQRLLLELLYHNLCANLYRPFISFKPGSPPPPSPASSAASCARRCAAHAIAATLITRQALAATDVLAGWHEAVEWQWSCAVTLAGFALAYPDAELASGAREAVGAAGEVLEAYGRGFAVAASAAGVVRGLGEALDRIAGPSQSDTKIRLGPAASRPMMSQGEQAAGRADDEGSGRSGEGPAIADVLDVAMELALAVDGYDGGNMWWPGMEAAGL
ncbi:fungal-specific transcription factor domain-containing protein [Hypoxylon sp. FL1284]|nr:fungal-specific transcription factor domain-containing protein [Hypoxylon sp. FL1284]